VNINLYPEELDWVNATISIRAGSNSFLELFCEACLRADFQNYELLRPVVAEFMRKYPAPPARIAAERQDRGAQ
jgi:hypothetical protein